MDHDQFGDFRSGKLELRGKPLVKFSPWGFVANSPLSLMSSERPVSAPLFAKIPEVKDVSQGGIGDCWFLAAVMAILNLPDGPEILLRSLRDIGRDDELGCEAVVVRLFDAGHTPHYLKMPRSIIESHVENREYHAALSPSVGAWPLFIEKACTAFDDQLCFSPGTASYGRIAGGWSDRALGLLLGVPAKKKAIPKQEGPLEVRTPGQPVEQVLTLLLGGLQPYQDRDVIARIFPVNTDQMFATWQVWLRIHPRFFDELAAFCDRRMGVQVTIPGKGLFSFSRTYSADKVFRTEHLVQFLRDYYARDVVPLEPHVMPQVINAISAYLTHSCAFPGQRGSGRYAEYQHTFYAWLKHKWQSGVPIVLDTKSYMGNGNIGDTGHSAGEPKVKGLVANHAYAVLHMYEVNERCMIRIGNPWGHYGRMYLWQNTGTMTERANERLQQRLKLASGDPSALSPSMALEIEEGVFDLDLYDLTKRFAYVHYTTEKPSLAHFMG
jgi:hypothetical protein